MGFHIVKIEGLDFAAGLFWQALTGKDDVKTEIKKLGYELNNDFAVTRRLDIVQAGFASKADGAQKGHLSLAAAVSKYGENLRNWIGAFELPDGNYFYIGIRDNNFLPHGDFAGTKDEVLQQMQQDISISDDWDKIYAPGGFYIQNAEDVLLTDFLPRKKNGKIDTHKWWALQPVKPSIPWGTIITAASIGAMVLGGIYYYEQYKKQKEEEVRQAHIAQMRELMMKNKLTEAPPMLPHPWASIPPVTSLVDTCLGLIQQSLVTPAGWTLDKYTCSPGGFSFDWVRVPGSNTSTAFMLLVPTAVMDISGEKANLTSTIQFSEANVDEAALPPGAVTALLTRFQLRGFQGKLTFVPPPPVIPPKEGESATPVPDWQTYRFEFNSPVSPLQLKDILQLNGLRLTKLTYMPTGSSRPWLIEGELYTRLE